MPRKVTKSLKRTIKPDRVYKNVLISKTINKVMKDGKKQIAEKLVYSALEVAAVKAKVDPVEVLDTAVKNVSPNVMVKSKRIGGANYQVPMEVRGDRKVHYALIWILAVSYTHLDVYKRQTGVTMRMSTVPGTLTTSRT